MGVVALRRVESSEPGIQPVTPTLAGRFLPLHHQGSPSLYIYTLCVYVHTCVCMLLLVSGHENAKATRTTDFDK